MSKSNSLTSKIYEAWRNGHFVLLLSEPMVQEIEDVVGRPEVLQKLRFSPVAAGALSFCYGAAGALLPHRCLSDRAVILGMINSSSVPWRGRHITW
jgi:hypothetical protein